MRPTRTRDLGPARARRRDRVRPAVESLEGRALLAVALLKDVNPEDLFPAQITDVGGTAYFATKGPGDGTQLWTSDGSAGGTKKLADFPAPATAQTSPAPANLTDFGGALYFSAPNPVGAGDVIDRVDPVSGAISRVVTLSGGLGTAPSNFASAGGYLFFTDTAPDGNLNLLRTDGTAAGTIVLATDIRGTNFLDGQTYAAGSLVYFLASDAAHGSELWRSDGTVSGTRMIADLNPGPGNAPIFGETLLGSSLLFQAPGHVGTGALWSTDGTTETEIASNVGVNGAIAVSGSTAYFGVQGAQNGLWQTDGTAGGTQFVASVPEGIQNVVPHVIRAAAGRVYMAYLAGNGQYDLFSSDGSAAPAVKLGTFSEQGEIALSPASAVPTAATLGADLIFTAYDDAHGSEPWISDGTPAGTHLLFDASPGPSGSDPRDLTTAGGRVVFAAHGGDATGNQLWSTDGTAGGTSALATFPATRTASSVAAPQLYNPDAYKDPAVTVGGATYFAATDPDHGQELWKTDGTAAGTVRVSDTAPGPADGGAQSLTAFGGDVAFITQSGSGGRGAAIWKSDGTPEGTTQVTPAGLSGIEAGFRIPAFQGRLVFEATDTTAQTGLWSSDGTPAGTSEISPLPLFTRVRGNGIVATPTTIFFNAGRSGSSEEVLWASDGTAAGTGPVAPVSAPELVTLGSKAFFAYFDPTNGYRLWVSDGTAAGTMPLKSFWDIANLPNSFAVLGSRLYFLAADATGASQLWATDGTVAGTVLVKALGNPTTYGATQMVATGSSLYINDSSPFGERVYKSDGTAAGTAALTVNGHALTGNSVSGLLYAEGDSAYLSIGIAAGQTIYRAGPGSSSLDELSAVGPTSRSAAYPAAVLASGDLLAFGDDGTHGYEPMVLDTAPVLASISDRAVNPGGIVQFTASATDPHPSAVLRFGLAPGAPSGAAIDATTGAFTWPVPTSQPLGTVTITVIVSDGLTPPRTDSRAFHVTVAAVNHAPTIAPIPAQDGAPGETFNLNASATDPDAGQVLTYSLDPGAPAGMSVNSSTGLIRFTPTAAGAYTATVRATDNGTPALDVATAVTITVKSPVVVPTNHAPTLAPIAPQAATQGDVIRFQATATDPDAGQTLTYSLDPGAPSGAAIDPRTGEVSYPTSAPGTFTLVIRATDNGSPALSVAQGVTLTVRPATTPPPAPVEVASVTMTARKGSVATITIHLSDALVKGAAEALGNYALAQITVKGRGKKAKTVLKRVALKSASYNDTGHTVTLVVGGKLPMKQAALLTIRSAGVIDASGRPVDGNGDGQPGGDYSATLKGGVATRSVRILSSRR